MLLDQFTQEKPSEIALVVRLHRVQTSDGVQYRIDGSIEILDSDGKVIQHRKGDLAPHLSAETKLQLRAFIDNLYQEARVRILGI